MRRLFSRVGLWLFIVALAWYFGGNALLDYMYNKSVTHARSLHKYNQYFDAGKLTGVVIRAEKGNGYIGTVSLVADPGASQVMVRNENLALSTDAAIADGVLNIALTPLSRRYHEAFKQVEIRLPPSLNKVGFDGGVSVELSGRLPVSTSELHLEILDCEAGMTLSSFTVNKLRLTATCRRPAEKRCCDARFSLGESVTIDQLDVSMLRGKFTFSSDAVPQRIQLNLGETVEVTGRSAFLQAAKFGRLQ